MEDMYKEILERRLGIIESRVALLERAQQGGKAIASVSRPAPDTAAVASEADLDGPYGDPVVRKDPPRWKGATHVGMAFSQCSAEYLENLASFFDWQAKMDEEQGRVTQTSKRPTAPYKRKDAAKARGWAARARVAAHSGASTSTMPKRKAEPIPEPDPMPDFSIEDDDEIPF